MDIQKQLRVLTRPTVTAALSNNNGHCCPVLVHSILDIIILTILHISEGIIHGKEQRHPKLMIALRVASINSLVSL